MSEAHRNKPVIGIVGGVGAGKSAAAAQFAALGCMLIDGDAIGHEVLTDPQVRQELQDRWGRRVLTADGLVDREALGQIVFANPADLEALNRMTWPRIRARCWRCRSRSSARAFAKSATRRARSC